MYKCYECGCVFENPANYEYDRTPGLGFEGGSFIETVNGCPECEGAYGEIMECECCGRKYLADDLSKTKNGLLCEECIYEYFGGENE